jgi:cell division septum initiation protein DivIVA
MSIEDAKRLIREQAAEIAELEKQLRHRKMEIDSLRNELQFARNMQHRCANRAAWVNV